MRWRDGAEADTAGARYTPSTRIAADRSGVRPAIRAAATAATSLVAAHGRDSRISASKLSRASAYTVGIADDLVCESARRALSRWTQPVIT